jgi:hypothetical protein
MSSLRCRWAVVPGQRSAWRSPRSRRAQDAYRPTRGRLQRPAVHKSQPLFGFGHPLEDGIAGAFDGPGDKAGARQGLKATSSRTPSAVGDMIALWPDDAHPTHAIIRNEIDTAARRSAAPQTDFGSAVQSAAVGRRGHHMMTGHNARTCAPDRLGHHPRREENGATGRLWEILDLLEVTGVTVNRAAGTTSDPPMRRPPGARPASYEGVVALPDGMTTSRRAGALERGAGGGVFKFVPTTHWPAATRSPASTSHRWRLKGLGPSPASPNRTSTMRSTNNGAWPLGAADHACQPAHLQPRRGGHRRAATRAITGPRTSSSTRAPGPMDGSGSAGTTPAMTGRTSGARRCA